MNKIIPLAIIALLFGSSCVQKTKETKTQPYLIILSLDGFRWDYTEKANTPTFDSLAMVGVKAESMKASFPTKTFPNHYTIATGLVPDNHGIVLNSFYATDLEKEYSIRDRVAVTNGEFYGGEPMWNVAEDQGVKAATLFWVGSEAAVDGKRPSYWSIYNSSLPLESRIDSLSNWLTLTDEERPHLIMWYYYEPDNTGHHYGPESHETIVEIEKLDTFVNDFFTKMRKLPIFDELNFVILSDHGMAQLSAEKIIHLDDYIDTTDIEFYNGGNPVINIKVKEGKLDKVYNDIYKKHKNLMVWKHGEVPEHLNYGNNIRTQDMTIVSDSGWSIYWSWKEYKSLGTHGYSNECKDMHAIFYAAGPAFKTNHIHPTFDNVDVYPLVGEILNLKMPSSDGKVESIIDMLK